MRNFCENPKCEHHSLAWTGTIKREIRASNKIVTRHEYAKHDYETGKRDILFFCDTCIEVVKTIAEV